jgi:hypothetical protein
MWETIIPMIVGMVLSFLASFLDNLSAKQKTVAISFVAFLVAAGTYYFVPELNQGYAFMDVLMWALAATGSGTVSYSMAKGAKNKAMGK